MPGGRKRAFDDQVALHLEQRACPGPEPGMVVHDENAAPHARIILQKYVPRIRASPEPPPVALLHTSRMIATPNPSRRLDASNKDDRDDRYFWLWCPIYGAITRVVMVRLLRQRVGADAAANTVVSSSWSANVRT